MSISCYEGSSGVPDDRHLLRRDHLSRSDETAPIRLSSHVADRVTTERALRRALEEVAALKARLSGEPSAQNARIGADFEDIVGRTPVLVRLLDQINRVAITDSTVLVTGETGTGKELVARAVHRQSRRREKPLIIVNCAALPATLVETELFGHERGAFTGATSRRVGRFELADRGTIFLDEVGELPEDIQVKLLRVLQTGELERVGSTRSLRVDVRLIAATNRNLEKAVEAGRFRADLYYRLHVFPVHVPSLRERRDDIPLLVTYLAEKKGRTVGKMVDRIPQAVMLQLMQYSWPGNVRELENVVERAIILSRDGTLSLEGAFAPGLAASNWELVRGGASPVDDQSRLTLSEVERAHITRVCEDCGWRIKGPGSASVRLGLKPSTLYFRMQKLGIVRPG